MTTRTRHMTHLRNPTLTIRIVPTKQLPQIALAGARHHEHQVRRLINEAIDNWLSNGDFNASLGPILDANQFSFHIRSFFWEAFAATDMILQWVNEALGLGLDQAQVRWKDIRLCKPKNPDTRLLWSQLLPALSSYRESADFFEISTYRHMSHANFLPATSILGRNRNTTFLALETARVGQEIEDLRQHLPRYLASLSAHMAELVGLLDGPEPVA